MKNGFIFKAMDSTITSLQNPLVKRIVQLQEKSRERKKSGQFVIEGIREIGLALKAGYEITHVLICPQIIDASDDTGKNLKFQSGTQELEISPAVYGKIAYRESTEGIIAIAKGKHHELEHLQLGIENPLILVAEAPEKPGNIGALLRTADAAGLDAVIIANPRTDLYNPNIIRSSVGCVFTNRIALADTTSVIAYLKQNNIRIYAATLQASEAYHLQDYSKAAALVVGTEATGLSQEWIEDSDQNILIPMAGAIDSMNVSVAAGILIFEAKRQRKFE